MIIMEIVLYRAGGLTPLTDIPVKKQWFTEASIAYMKPEFSPRNTSVFASRTRKEAEGWVDWRHDLDLDGDIYRITITDVSSPIFAHYCDHYENAGFCKSMPDYAVEGAFEKSVKDYWETAVDVRVSPAPAIDEHGYMEVLIPYNIAVNAKWELIEERPAPVWEDEETYFDLENKLVKTV